MLRWFRGLSVSTKLRLTQALVVIVCMTVFGGVVTSRVTAVDSRRSIEDLRARVSTIVDMVSVYDSSLTQTADKLAKVFGASYPQSFNLNPSVTVPIGGVATPTLTCGDEVVNLNSARVDRFTETTGAVATVFAKMNDDFVRVTTSLKKEDGSRAVGTLLGTAHPGHRKLLQGQEYVGKARLFGRDYMTKYVPILSAQGEVVGALFVGLDFTEGLRALKEKIKGQRVGTSGYVYVVDANPGQTYGTFVIHPFQEGKSGLDAKDVYGRAFVKELLQSKSGATSYEAWDGHSGEKGPRGRVVAHEFYPAWNWLVAATVTETELLHEANAIRNSIAVAGVVMVGFIVLVLRFCAVRWISDPLRMTLGWAVKLSEGDLTQRLRLDRPDEFGQLAEAMNRMGDDLRTIIGQIAESSADLAAAAEALSSATSQIAASNAEVSAQAQGAAAAAEQMRDTVERVARNTGAVSSAADGTRQVAVDGARVISHAVDAFREISEVVERAAVTVKGLGEQFAKVGGVTGVIEDIADQTNLLALNAAIEAARAGHHGRGFAVVADEVRKLAEKTVKATQEISHTITLTQAESRGAMEAMGRGQEVVRRGTALGERAGEAIHAIEGRVVEASDQTQQTATATTQLAATIRAMTTGVEQIASGVKQNSLGVEEIARTVDSLAQKAVTLKKTIAHFRL